MGIGVVLPAGGSGTRFGGPLPKQFLEVRPGRPLLRYPVETFHDFPGVESVVLVLPQEFIQDGEGLLPDFPKLNLVIGGVDRWLSVRNGVEALPASVDTVLIHDVARPFTPRSVIRKCVEAMKDDMAVIAALPASDTVKEVGGSKVARTLDRNRLVLVQTPQCFPRTMLKTVYERGLSSDSKPTDEAQIAEAAGFHVGWVTGSFLSRKITEPEDWEWAEWVAARLESGKVTLDD
ncbi:MAG TPA: 2-C-methyl-D-erythritol 4-phosphate cytidylyltransferase [Fibrobacteres bacterium]|nr:2-C-methyl-D-erythritol 4-phosphate cytidylyltransferase [Fibrobacterota bacterium]